jgi:hypothetical protein
MWQQLKQFVTQHITGAIQRLIQSQQSYKETSDDFILSLAMLYNGQLSADRVQRHTKMTWDKAYERLYIMHIKGILEAGEKKHGLVRVFTLREDYWHEAKMLQLHTPFVLTDADIIECVVDCGGTASAAQLCLRMRIAVDVAQTKLDELAAKGVFTTHLNDAGAVLYELRDTKMLPSA